MLPIIDPYVCIKVIPARNEVSEREKRKMVDSFPTEWIPYGSPYWQEFFKMLGSARGNLRMNQISQYDGELIHITAYSSGKVKATRNHTNVVIRHAFEVPTPVVVSGKHKPKEEKAEGKFPTEFIPKDSPYYAELVTGRTFFFSRESRKWVHTHGRDGVTVAFRLGIKGESLSIHRNGVTVEGLMSSLVEVGLKRSGKLAGRKTLISADQSRLFFWLTSLFCYR